MKPTSRLAELMEDWMVMLRRDGLRAALPAIGLEIARLPYRHLRFFIIARSLKEPLPDIQPRIALVIRPFEQADLDLVREIDRPSEARLCMRRLENGHQGLAALYRGRLAGYAWGCAEVNVLTDRVQIPLKPGDVLCNDAFTTPAFRGQGVQTSLALARFRLFRDLGFHRAICYIEIKNAPSLAVWQRKLNGVTLGSVNFQRIGPWYRVDYDGVGAGS
jgi:GNAT superfamily N-acetyltransferase